MSVIKLTGNRPDFIVNFAGMLKKNGGRGKFCECQECHKARIITISLYTINSSLNATISSPLSALIISCFSSLIRFLRPRIITAIVLSECFQKTRLTRFSSLAVHADSQDYLSPLRPARLQLNLTALLN
ncbi:hypothetical protein PUN28_010373 [Cardiocondyla obscurior]|uniref:Uncharacterized protein n=1 Tax=Cardiocondyla obscurior TaxID=286306 RepID=A0AAW2FNH4_9HYME